jgi:hypothetical protein
VLFAALPPLPVSAADAGSLRAKDMTGTQAAATVVRRVSAAEAVAEIRRRQRRVITFLGFSGAGYEDSAAVAREIERALSPLDAARVVVCAGATAEGIGAVYPIARRLGFATIGIVSSLAEREGARFSPDADIVYVIADTTWGGRMPDGALAPVSAAMVEAADELIAIGGGDIARDETAAAIALGKPVRFVAADMNHAAARDKARARQQPEPDDFGGTVHGLFPR